MALVIDDHLLIDVLADTHDEWLRAEMARSAIYTTTAWYYRVASAARRGSGSGTLSGRLAQLESAPRAELLTQLGRLPDWIGLIGPRLLVPVMAALETRRRPNVLTAEALALALVIDGAIAVTVDAPLLRVCAHDLGITIHVQT
jgi:hypothetical protein